MIATLIAFALALFTHFYAPAAGQLVAITPWAPLAAAILLPMLYLLAYSSLLQPLVTAEHRATPRALALFAQNKQRRVAGIYVMIYPLLCVLAVLVGEPVAIAGWVVASGLAIDALRQLLSLGFQYLDPYTALAHTSDRAVHAAKQMQTAELCHWQAALTATALKAVGSDSVDLAQEALRSCDTTIDAYLKTAKTSTDERTSDYVSYTVSRLLRELDTVYHQALDSSLEPVANAATETVGKVAIRMAEFDLQMATLPITFLGRFAQVAAYEGLEDVGMQAGCTMEAVAKTLVNDGRAGDLKTPMVTALTEMRHLAQEAFRQDKSTNVKYLKQPFVEIDEMLKAGALADHPDLPAIKTTLEDILGEFGALSQVMQRIPPRGKVEEESEEE